MRILAAGCVVVALLALCGCAANDRGEALPERVQALMSAAGTEQLTAVSVRGDVVEITYLDGSDEWTLREQEESGTASYAPRPLQMRSVDDLPLDDLARALEEQRDACEHEARADLEATSTGAMLISTACVDETGLAVDAASWVDGEPLPALEAWTSAEAVQTVLDETEALLGTDIVALDFIGVESFRQTMAGAVSIESLHEGPDGTCAAYPWRWLSADALDEPPGDALFSLTPCIRPTERAVGDLALLTGPGVMAAIESVASLAAVASFRVQTTDDGAGWSVRVFDADGWMLGDAPVR